MTAAQQKTVDNLVAEGFEVIVDAGEIVRLTRGADRRVVMADGKQKRGHHHDGRRKP